MSQNGESPPESDRLRESTSTSRRRALELILGAAVAAMGSGCLRAAGASAQSRRAPADPRVKVGTTEDLPPGTAKMVEYQGQPVLVLNHEGTLAAFSAICTHEGCLVEWSSARQIIHCPCHDGQYDTGGQVIAGPPPAPLLRFRVVVEGDLVYLDGVADGN